MPEIYIFCRVTICDFGSKHLIRIISGIDFAVTSSANKPNLRNFLMDDVSNIEKKILPLKTIVQLQTSGSLQEAHDAYIAYIEASDIDYRVLNLFGVCCLSLGKFQKAQQIFEHITASTTSINEALFHLIEAHIGQGNLDAALGILDSPKCEILERETVLLTKARILMMQKDISAAQIPLRSTRA